MNNSVKGPHFIGSTFIPPFIPIPIHSNQNNQSNVEHALSDLPIAGPILSNNWRKRRHDVFQNSRMRVTQVLSIPSVELSAFKRVCPKDSREVSTNAVHVNVLPIPSVGSAFKRVYPKVSESKQVVEHISNQPSLLAVSKAPKRIPKTVRAEMIQKVKAASRIGVDQSTLSTKGNASKKEKKLMRRSWALWTTEDDRLLMEGYEEFKKSGAVARIVSQVVFRGERTPHAVAKRHSRLEQQNENISCDNTI